MTDVTHTDRFARKVDRRSRETMARFLAGHFRYDTMNSWNQATSYANNVKLTNVLYHADWDKAFALLDMPDTYDIINQPLHQFDTDHGWQWQAGYNGRSGGYIVLYEGGRKRSQYKRRCNRCGQLNYQADSVKCGRCGDETNMVDYEGWETFTRPGRGVDHGVTIDEFLDRDEWPLHALRDRAELVCEFDAACDRVVDEFAYLLNHAEIVTETVMVPHNVKHLEVV